MSQEKNTQKQDSQEKNNTTTDDAVRDAIGFLKTVIKFSGWVLVIFLLIFIFGVFYSQCTKKDYTNSLASIERATQYQQINKMGFESSGQLATNFTAINNNTEVLKNYLDKDVKNQFDNVSSNISALNNQISNLYSLLNNTLMVMSIILGIFTLVIAVLGFYISKIIEERYSNIKSLNLELDKARRSTDEAFRMVKSFKEEIEASSKSVNETKGVVEELNKQIQDALVGKGWELFKNFRENHIDSIISDLKENVENIEFYHSELINNLRYLSFNDIVECVDKYYMSSKISTDSKISSKYLHILLLLDADKCFKNIKLLDRIIAVNISLPELPFTYVQMREVLYLFTHHDFAIDKIEKARKFVKNLIKKDVYDKLESCFRSIETDKNKTQFIKELLIFNKDIFDRYISRWRAYYQERKNIYAYQLKDMELIEELKKEMSL